MKQQLILFLTMLSLLSSCQMKIELPIDATPISRLPQIYPDYTQVVIPPNISPLNFLVKEEGNLFRLEVACGKYSLLLESKDAIFNFKADEWRNLLVQSKGQSIQYRLYVLDGDKWYAYKSFTNLVANESIDPYIAYRLIEPGYEHYRQMGLYQRSLEDFDEQIIYENNRMPKEEENHCINCHTFRNRQGSEMLFHVRENMSGTLFVKEDQAVKINMRVGDMIASCVYPAWNPVVNRVVFSINQTGQTFHIFNQNKIEVMDKASDLVIYDVELNQMRQVITSSDKLETYPTWSPNGDRLYYTSCTPSKNAFLGNEHLLDVMSHYDSLRYDLMTISYDTILGTFGEPEPLFEASKINMSVSFPRVSPDGRYILFTLAPYGQFHIWNAEADLFVLDLKKKNIRKLSKANSVFADSYHSWSSNGRWIIFSSRRDDGSYTRPYIAYFDVEGNDYKAFVLPQSNPLYNIELMKSYNVPEFLSTPVKIPSKSLQRAVYQQCAIPARYMK